MVSRIPAGPTTAGVAPQVSVVIPVFNAQEDLNRFIGFIEHSEYPQLQLVVVDDASSPPARLPETSVPALLIRNSTNHGKAYSVNCGARVATGKYLVISDPDVEPARDLIQTWVASFESDDHLGVLGAYLYYAGDRSRLTHAGALLSKHLHLVTRQFADTEDAGYSTKEFRASNLVLDDIYAVRSELWREVGGFDANNFDTMYEDVDFQARVSEAGSDIALIANARAYHHQELGTSSPGTLGWARRTMSGFKLKALPRNRLIFLRKHDLAHGGGLIFQSFLLVAFYGGMAVLAGTSVRSRAIQGATVLSAVFDGLRRPIALCP
jgi:GT2 family glycosyltransferase